jgi:CheY-like chemotaxis protein
VLLNCNALGRSSPARSGHSSGVTGGDLGARPENCVLKVLIAEDDLMIADLVEDILVDEGYAVCGIARSVAEALALARHHKPDLAVLEVVLTTADGDASLSKPYRSIDLLRSLEIVAEIVASGTASPPFPKGFQVLRPAATVPSAVAA